MLAGYQYDFLNELKKCHEGESIQFEYNLCNPHRDNTPGSNSTGASLLGASHRMKPYILAVVIFIADYPVWLAHLFDLSFCYNIGLPGHCVKGNFRCRNTQLFLFYNLSFAPNFYFSCLPGKNNFKFALKSCF